MANAVVLGLKTEADTRRALRRFHGRPLDSLTGPHLQWPVVAQITLFPKGSIFWKQGDIQGE